MKDAGGQGATTKLAKRKLDMNLLRNKLQLAASIAEVIGWIKLMHKPRSMQKGRPRKI